MKSTPQKIKHLYWRAEFGVLPNEIEILNSKKNIESIVEEIFQRAKPIHKFSTDFDTPSLSEMKDMDGKDKKQLRKGSKARCARTQCRMDRTNGRPQKRNIA